MTYQELNQYILHYVTENKTKSAIMLTAPWGTGKSYYIQNELKPFLEKEENGKIKCLTVSLYGLKDPFEVSKALYLESRIGFLNNTSEKVTTGKFASKTILKGVTSFFGIDLSHSDKEMQELFESVDFSGKLIILEDLERSGIDILEVLGYVNNLVEQDGVKVLLVANEDEIIQYKPIEAENKEEQETAELLDRLSDHKNRLFTDNTIKYLKIKEKTVSDTIQFKEDYQTAIKDIIQIFGNTTLNNFLDSENVKNILNIMETCKTSNLRSFIYSCQKAADIFNKIDEEYLSNNDFIQAVFFGVLYFVLNQKSGKTDKWGQEKYFSIELGDENAPLFKFCYEYIRYQIEDFSEMEEAYKAYSEFVIYDRDRSNSDNDIIVLQTYYIQTEQNIRTALDSIAKRLENPDDISFYQYGTIAVYTIMIKDILGYDDQKIENLLVNNLKGRGDKLQLEQIFRTILSNECTQQQKEEYELLRKRMAESLKIGDSVIPNFNYLPDQSDDFYNYIIENYGKFLTQNSFASSLDMYKLAEMFKKSTAEQKRDIRGAFLTMYRSGNIGEFLSNDKQSIEQLIELVEKDKSSDVGDKIQQLQYDWFIDNLKEIAEKLS